MAYGSAPRYNEIYFFPAAGQEYSATVTVEIFGIYPALDTSTTFSIDVAPFAAPTTGVPAAVDIKTLEGTAPVSDPRDIYVIPETPLVLVTSHGDDSVAVINSSTATPTYMHNFPSYGSGPTRIACGVAKADTAK